MRAIAQAAATLFKDPNGRIKELTMHILSAMMHGRVCLFERVISRCDSLFNVCVVWCTCVFLHVAL